MPESHAMPLPDAGKGATAQMWMTGMKNPAMARRTTAGSAHEPVFRPRTGVNIDASLSSPRLCGTAKYGVPSGGINGRDFPGPAYRLRRAW